MSLPKGGSGSATLGRLSLVEPSGHSDARLVGRVVGIVGIGHRMRGSRALTAFTPFLFPSAHWVGWEKKRRRRPNRAQLPPLWGVQVRVGQLVVFASATGSGCWDGEAAPNISTIMSTLWVRRVLCVPSWASTRELETTCRLFSISR